MKTLRVWLLSSALNNGEQTPRAFTSVPRKGDLIEVDKSGPIEVVVEVVWRKPPGELRHEPFVVTKERS